MDVEPIVKHKFLEDSGMTFQEVFDFAFKKLIPVLQGLAKELGEDHFLEALKKVASECALKAGQATARQLPCNDFAAFTGSGSEPSHFGEHVLTREIVEDTPQAYELKVTSACGPRRFERWGLRNLDTCSSAIPTMLIVRGSTPE